MSPSTASRRERLRAETTAEIKAVAMQHVTERGPDALSLRAIARDMGMTANAIYSYFPTRDDLVTALIDDLSTSLTETLETASGAQPPDDPARRLVAWGDAFREWAAGNPCRFRLVFGDPVPGYHPAERPGAEMQRRAVLGLLEIVATAWPSAEALLAGGAFEWSDFEAELVAPARERFPDIPPAAVALTLRTWSRIHGLLSLEVYGHLGGHATAAGKVYRSEMDDILRSLGLMPPA